MDKGLARIAEFKQIFEQCTDRDSELDMLAYNGAHAELRLDFAKIRHHRPDKIEYLQPMEALMDEYPQLPQVVFDNAEVHTDKRFDRVEMLMSKYTHTKDLKNLYAVIAIRMALDSTDLSFRMGAKMREDRTDGRSKTLSASDQALVDKLAELRRVYLNPRAVRAPTTDSSPSP
jgi:hypothetical protein